MARPSKLTPAVIEKANHYIDHHDEYDDPIPTIAGLADELRVRRETVWDWAKNDRDGFSNVVARLLSKQERILVGGSLKGDLNPTITKLLLTKHGYSERVQNEHSGPEGGPIKTEQITFVGVRKDD